VAQDAEVAVIGAGVVGLAVACELSRARSVVVLERHEGYGRENSSHNSGVIHAGLYYPKGWLKTELCIEGNRLLYDWAERLGVRVRRTGKLMIATDESELPALEERLAAGLENGVPELRMIGPAEVARLEPSIRAVAAVFSGTSGVIDQMGLMRSLANAAQENGALLAYKHTVTAIERAPGGFTLSIDDPEGGAAGLRVGALVNSAGLAADRVAAMLGYPLDGGEGVPRLRQSLVRGAYYDIVTPQKAARLQHLIYPLPHADRTGLGIHVTLDVDGGAHLGPDVEWLDQSAPLDFRANDTRRAEFLQSVQRYLPWLEHDDLMPGQVGYRTKLHDPGQPAADFLVWHDRGYVHLGGIESPGMTAGLAIARRVADGLS
jgi:L-2-hydroxyglutarate oxidase LhgO